MPKQSNHISTLRSRIKNWFSPAKKETKIKIMIVDDHSFMKGALSNALRRYENIEILGEAGNGKELLEKLETLQPDVITLDIQMPVMDGFTVLPLLQARHPAIRIVVVSFLNDPMTIKKAME